MVWNETEDPIPTATGIKDRHIQHQHRSFRRGRVRNQCRDFGFIVTVFMAASLQPTAPAVVADCGGAKLKRNFCVAYPESVSAPCCCQSAISLGAGD